jgi:BlaI family penicillinase repressor
LAPGRRKSTVKLSLGYLEMDVMPIVWRYGEVTVRKVFEELYASKKLAYTTIMTVMNRLTHKGVLKVDKSNIPFVYKASLGSKELAAKVIDEVVNRLLEGTSTPIVLHYLENAKMNATDKKAVRTILTEDGKRKDDAG